MGMTTPAFNPHDASELDQHRRANGQFGTVPRAETVDVVHLTPVTGPVMPGLDQHEAIRFRDLDALVEGSGFAPDALTPEEAVAYSELCAKVDAARALGEDGWMPECPFHKDREFPGSETDQWGRDVRCHVCFGTPGDLVSVNRLGLRQKAGVHKWAAWGLTQHMAEIDRLAAIRDEVERRKAERATRPQHPIAARMTPDMLRAPEDV